MSAVVPASLEAVSQAELFDSLENLQELLARQLQLSAETFESLQGLAARCEARFAREESSPWYTGIHEAAPWLSAQVEKLAEEHRQLRQSLAGLSRCQERQLPHAKTLRRFAAQLNAFRGSLVAHEEGERELCFQVYMTDIGSKD